jgi:hypothetical protein
MIVRMTCPACLAVMVEETLDGHYGRTVALNLCQACRGIWFDGLESLQLTPGATLRLFERFGADAPTAAPAESGRCPRCGVPLLPTHDLQRDTPFSYLRCPADHGHFITFFQFLREKNFVRRLSGAELATLRDSVREVHCSNCGAPVSLDRDAVCAYCHTPLAILDPHQIEATVKALQAAETRRTTVDPTLPARLAIDRLSVLGANVRAADGEGAPRGVGLVEAGIRVLLAALELP